MERIAEPLRAMGASIKTRDGEVGGGPESFRSEREVWKWIALATLMILAVEWWIYHRRITL